MNRYNDKCSVSTCDRIIGRKGGRGLCSAHLKRLSAGVDLQKPIQKRGEGWNSQHGYRYLGTRGVHRLLVERALGRKLTYNEIVHHKDGNKQNNDLSNLEVMDRGEHIRLHTLGKCNGQRLFEKSVYGYCLPDRGAGGKP